MGEENRSEVVEGEGREPVSTPEQDKQDFDAAFAKAVGEEEPSPEHESETDEDAVGNDAENPPSDEPDKATGEAGEDRQDIVPGNEPEEDPVELHRKTRQMLEATEGRLRKTQEELAALRRRASEPAMPPAPEAMKVEDLPEESREDVAAFVKANPDYAAVMLERSRSGDRLRRALAEYGPEHVVVEEMAERAFDVRNRERTELEHAARAAEGTKAAHFSAIGKEHPDFAEAFANREAHPEAFAAYRGKLEAWAESKTGAEYKQIMGVMEHGTAPEVIGLLHTYKKELAARDDGRREAKHRAAEAAMVPRGKPSPPPQLNKSSGTFDDGWDKDGR